MNERDASGEPAGISARRFVGRWDRVSQWLVHRAASAAPPALVARLEGAAPVSLHWDAKFHANTGELFIPDQMIPGTYHLTVTAEDIAHNMGSQGVDIEIVP